MFHFWDEEDDEPLRCLERHVGDEKRLFMDFEPRLGRGIV